MLFWIAVQSSGEQMTSSEFISVFIIGDRHKFSFDTFCMEEAYRDVCYVL
jgi:hypothetical protein